MTYLFIFLIGAAIAGDPYRSTPTRSLADGSDERVHSKIVGNSSSATLGAVAQSQAIVESGSVWAKITSAALPTGGATAANQSTEITQLTAINANTDDMETRLGSTSESAADSDTSTSGINGLIKRLNQHGTTSEGKIDTTNISIGATSESVAASDTATSGLNGLLKRALQGITSFIANQTNGNHLTGLYNSRNSRRVMVDTFEHLKVQIPTRLLGGNFIGSSLNTQVWTPTATAGGTGTVGSGFIQLQTNTTANGAYAFQSTDIAPFMGGSVNTLLTGVRVHDTGTVNNTRLWGAFAASNGVYFKLAGTTFSVCLVSNSVETCASSGSFTGSGAASFILDTNFHSYEIQWNAGSVSFIQDRNLLHTMTATTAGIADTYHFPIRFSNTNSGGSTSNVVMSVRSANIHRYGQSIGRPRVYFTNTANTTVLKMEPGTLHNVCVNRSGGLGTTTLTIYDNTAASGTVLTNVTFAGNGSVCKRLDVDFNVGLAVVNSSANQEVDVTWE